MRKVIKSLGEGRPDWKVLPWAGAVPECRIQAAANVLTNPALDPKAKIREYKARAVQVERVED